jgi:hypothetical protein
VTLPDGENIDATSPTRPLLSRPAQPPRQVTAWAVIEAFLSELAEGEPGVSVKQATAELLSRLRIRNLVTGDTLLRRLAAADRAAWVLGRMPDHGEEANQAGRAAFAEWRRLVSDDSYAMLAQQMSDGGYTRLIEADGAGRQRMWDNVTRAVPGSHQAHLGPLDSDAPLPEPYASAPQADNIRRVHNLLQQPSEPGEPS